jgi:hypothetical protein
MKSVWGRGEKYTGFWWGNRRERDYWGDTDVNGRIILRFQEVGLGVWTGSSRFRIGTVGRHW